MNLSQLRFARALAAAGSFTAAANRCFVTQPTLSNGIAELEQELGQRLFRRTTRRVGLTEFGAHMLPAIAAVLGAQEALVVRAQAFLNPRRRVIRIGTSPLISADLLGATLEPFRSHNPDIDLVLRELNLDDLNDMLDQGLLDFVFGVVGLQRKGRARQWQRALLYREPLLFIPSRFEWRGPVRNGAVNVRDIAGETFVMVPDTCGLARATRALFRRQRRGLREYSGEAMSYQVLEQWAHLGVGAAVLPSMKVSGRAKCALPITNSAGDAAYIGYEAVWPKAAPADTHASAFARHLREVVPALIAGLTRGKGLAVPRK